MRRHVLPKRHVSPKRHLSPKRHGATSGARLRSRTKTRGRSRKAMRGGMHTGDNSKNSSALPWIAGAAGAALLGTGGVIGVNKYKKLKQEQVKTQSIIDNLIQILNKDNPDIDKSNIASIVSQLKSNLDRTTAEFEVHKKEFSVTKEQKDAILAEQQRLTAATEDAVNRANKIVADAREVGGQEVNESFNRDEALVQLRRQEEEKNAKLAEKTARIALTCRQRTAEYNKSAKILYARILILKSSNDTDSNDASNSNDNELQNYIKNLKKIPENTVSTPDLISGLEKLKSVEQELNVAICNGTLTFDNFLALMVKIQDTFGQIPSRPQVNIHKYLEDDFKILDVIDFKIVKQLLIEKAQAQNRSGNLDDLNSQILTGIDSFKGICKLVNGQMLHRDLLAKFEKFKNSLQTAYRDAQNADRKLTAYNALLK